jgi:hypothetical protein
MDSVELRKDKKLNLNATDRKSSQTPDVSATFHTQSLRLKRKENRAELKDSRGKGSRVLPQLNLENL